MLVVAPSQVWLFSRRTDLLVFGGTALVSAAVVLGGGWLGIQGEAPLWMWLALVVGIDVAHVWSTLFRVYLDGEERRRRPLLYVGLPIAAYALGVLAHHHDPLMFWRILAYVAVAHFIRQQYGWIALYGRRAGAPKWERRLDAAAIYAATLGPVIWWHAHLPREFSWFVERDFFVHLPTWVGSLALGLHALVLFAWLAAQLWRVTTKQGLQLGKVLLVAATWVVWFFGIVVAADDFAFTVFNVALHGIPYFALLWRYAKGRSAEGGYGKSAVLLRAGPGGFLAFLVAIAFVEELLWDRLVWGERGQLFGASNVATGEVLDLVVPLLALPQLTHYLLDAFVWKPSREPRLLARLGWVPASTGSEEDAEAEATTSHAA